MARDFLSQAEETLIEDIYREAGANAKKYVNQPNFKGDEQFFATLTTITVKTSYIFQIFSSCQTKAFKEGYRACDSDVDRVSKVKDFLKNSGQSSTTWRACVDAVLECQARSEAGQQPNPR